MARYIDADLLLERIYPYNGVDKSKYAINAKAVFEAIRKSPTADVVPKSELSIVGVQNMALVNTKEELQRRLVAVESVASAAIEKASDMVIEAKLEVAREIFEEIDKIAMPYATPLGNCAMSVGIVSYELLKKKYTEGNQ